MTLILTFVSSFISVFLGHVAGMLQVWGSERVDV